MHTCICFVWQTTNNHYLKSVHVDIGGIEMTLNP